MKDEEHGGSGNNTKASSTKTTTQTVTQTVTQTEVSTDYPPASLSDPKLLQTMPFDIVFHGLFCHLTDDKTVVMIKAHEHVLRLVLRDDAVVSATGFAQDFVHAEAGEHSYDINGGTITIAGAVPAPIAVTAAFTDHVPTVDAHLINTPATLTKDVVARKVNADIAGYVTHEGGEYSVIDYFPEMAQFENVAAGPTCIARRVRLRITAAGDVTFDNGSGGTVTVKAGSSVRFENVTADGTAKPNEHYHHYYFALFGENAKGAKLVSNSAVEQHCGIAAIAAFPGADCANAHRP
jgi:hypothetical protein